jgi:hypothetical protein
MKQKVQKIVYLLLSQQIVYISEFFPLKYLHNLCGQSILIGFRIVNNYVVLQINVRSLYKVDHKCQFLHLLLIKLSLSPILNSFLDYISILKTG